MEVDKPEMVSKESFSFEFELPESDSLFQAKKNLLEKMGFNTKEIITLRNSLDPDGRTSSFDTMLRIVRIMKLDDIELYFLDDYSPPIEVYSPRNEITALNFILQLVENSLSRCTKLQNGYLQELRNSIIGKIDRVENPDDIKSKIMEDQSCNKENWLLQWGENNGMKSRLHIHYVEGAGRGAFAEEDLKVGDTALEIPTSLLISEDLLKSSDMYHVLEKRCEISSETMVLLWSMKERYNSSSKFKLYFDTLPEEFHTGLTFGLDALMALEGTTLFDELMQAKEHLQAQYDMLFPSLCNEHPHTFPAKLFTWEKYIWACELWYSNSMKIMFPNGELKTCLVPIAGFFNHSLYPHITNYGKVDSETSTLKFSLSRTCNAGEECFLSYGNFSSSHFITFYGFVPKGDNPYDIIPLELGGLEDDEDEGSQLSNSNHMVRGTWFSKNHEIFHYGLPSPLLDFLRKAKDPKIHTKVRRRESLENEGELLQQLRGCFESMMDGLGDSDLDDRENPCWDVKLAIEYRDKQRKIVSSIITSCNLGLGLVEDDLRKCTTEEIHS